MIGYGRICSKLWDNMSPFKSLPQQIPEDLVIELDTTTQEWLESIPHRLWLRHPRLTLAKLSQPPNLHRLRALLYLRGNYLRCLIYRQYVLSAQVIFSNISKAKLVVDIALDSIQVLMHLDQTTIIYSRQQTAFQYFLVNSLAILVLAVCHAPSKFTTHCGESFCDAVELVKRFSRRSSANTKLWGNVRGLLPRLERLGLQQSEEGQGLRASGSTVSASKARPQTQIPGSVIGTPDDAITNDADESLGFGNFGICNDVVVDMGFDNLNPDSLQIESHLFSLYDMLEQPSQSSILDDDDAWGAMPSIEHRAF